MIARGFKSVIWVAAVGGAALSCYMVSLRVATERADLTRVEAQIIAAKREIRTLQTELGTRGRMSQLESWNSDVLALSAPTAAQFLPDQVTLARFDQHESTLDERSATVRMASAETAPATPATAAPAAPMVRAVAPAAAAPQPMIHQASFTTGAAKPVLAEKKAEPDVKPKTVFAKDEKPTLKAAEAKKPEINKAQAAKPAAPKKAEVKTAAASKATAAAAKADTKLAATAKTSAKKAQGSGGN
jgi:hypothetical protein